MHEFVRFARNFLIVDFLNTNVLDWAIGRVNNGRFIKLASLETKLTFVELGSATKCAFLFGPG